MEEKVSCSRSGLTFLISMYRSSGRSGARPIKDHSVSLNRTEAHEMTHERMYVKTDARSARMRRSYTTLFMSFRVSYRWT